MVVHFLLKYWSQSFIALALSVTAGLLFLPNIPPLQNLKFDAYNVSSIRSLSGPLSLNGKLNNAEKLFEHLLKGPESIVHSDGILYTGVHGGWIVKLTNNTLTPFVKLREDCDGPFGEYCSRPLGLFMDKKKNNLYVCDAYDGLYKVNVRTGNVEQLVNGDTKIGGKKSKFFNSVTVTSDGKIYYTISDSNFDLKNLIYVLLADGSGRLIEYDPTTKKNTVLLEKLHMANGLAVSVDETYLVVAELKKNALIKYFLKGPKKGTSEIFVDGLPGAPDNVKVDSHGNFYVSLVLAKNQDLYSSYLDVLGQYPIVRKLIAHLMAFSQTACDYAYNIFPHVALKKISFSIGKYETYADFLPAVARVTVVKIDKNGKIIDSFHATDGRITTISDIEFVQDYAYLGSPFNNYLARVRLNEH